MEVMRFGRTASDPAESQTAYQVVASHAQRPHHWSTEAQSLVGVLATAIWGSHGATLLVI